jgi:hypothetical protein
MFLSGRIELTNKLEWFFCLIKVDIMKRIQQLI